MGRILPSRRELHADLNEARFHAESLTRSLADALAKIVQLETPREAAKIVIAALEKMDLPDTARALREIFGDVTP